MKSQVTHGQIRVLGCVNNFIYSFPKLFQIYGMYLCVCVSRSVVSDSLQPYGLQSTRLFCSWNSLGKNTRVGCHFLLQGIFPAQGLNPRLLRWQVDSLPLSHQGSPMKLSQLSYLNVTCEILLGDIPSFSVELKTINRILF